MRIKKTVLIAGIAMILAASGTVGYIWSQNQKKEQDYAKMEITFHKDRSSDSGIWGKDRQQLLRKAFSW